MPISVVVLLLNARPITLNEFASPGCAARATPSPAEINRSPLFTIPITLTGTRPVMATAGCVSSLPAPPFMVNAGRVEITPNTESLASRWTRVISADPPNSTTVPGS